MRFFTEFELRDQYLSSPFDTFHLPANSRLTQAAEQFLKERRVKVVRGDLCGHGPGEVSGSAEQGAPGTEGYILPNGRTCSEKPEHMTHLRGRNLVEKSHPRIRLRGKLDTLQARIIDTIIEARTMGQEKVAGQLEEILILAREVLRAEVTGEKMADPRFTGLDSVTIREMSHHPDRYLGVKHFLPSPGHGMLMSRLNLLRTAVRETELAAAEAFRRDGGETDRGDILENLNRMSSMVYIMMCRLLAGKYQIGGGGGRAAGR